MATTRAAPHRALATSPFSDTDATDWVDAGWGHAPTGAGAAPRSRRTTTDPVDDGSRAGHGGEERRRRGPLLAVLAVLVLLLVAAVVLLVPRVPQIAGALGIAPSDTSAPGVSAASGASASSAPGASASEAPSAGAGPGEITSARAEDPFGDGTENDESAPRAIDGNPATAWRSSTYSNAALGNLKRGVGLGLVLGDGTTPSTVTSLQLRTEGSGGRLEVRTSPDGGFDGSTVVATTQAGTDGATVEVPLDRPTTATHLLLWFTELPQTSSGYTAVVDEVSAR